MGRAEQLFEDMDSASAITGLRGQPEDSYFDCKVWPKNDDEAQRMLAKAACGLTNADGGVIVIGMRAEARPKNEPDVVGEPAPVEDTSFVKSRVLGLISNLVEPGIPNVLANEIPEMPGSKSGFVTILIPKSGSSPRRSRKHREFFQRVGSATIPMDYWQIEDMFGKRPHCKLEVLFREVGVEALHYDPRLFARWFILGVTNVGRGMARFPSVRFLQSNLMVEPSGIDGGHQFGLPLRPSTGGWASFRGGADDVIHPGETIEVAKIKQSGRAAASDSVISSETSKHNYQSRMWTFGAFSIEFELSSEGVATVKTEMSFTSITEERLGPVF